MTALALSDPIAPPVAPRTTRQRLPATVRSMQILDAALEVFAERGFAASRIDDIAATAGLSKGGIYTHFKSKDEIFEALLARSLMPPQAEVPALRRGELVTVDRLVEQVIDPMYAVFSDPNTVRTLRLLLADGARIPERVARWRASAIEPFHASIDRLVRRGVQQGVLRKSVLSQAPWLLISPGTHVMMERLLQGAATPAALAVQKTAHVAMLRELLEA